MELSQLHFHSWGIVANNKQLRINEVKVIPIEYRFAEDEVVVDNPTEVETNFATAGGDDTVKVTMNQAVTCKWLKLNSNRITAPDVRRNDQVMIWRMGDTDMYYWTDFNISNVKRLETAVYVWSADPENPVKDDLSNAYYLELSTHNKTITLTTSQANGEPFGYTLQLDTGYGKWVIEDTNENVLYLDSAETVIGFKNAMKTELRLDKKNIYAYAPNNIDIEAVKDINVKCTNFNLTASKAVKMNCDTYSLTAKTSAEMKTAKYTINASATIDVTTGVYSMTAKSVAITANSVQSTAPVTIATGLFKCLALSVGAVGSEAAGVAEFDCPVEFRKPVVFTAPVVGTDATFTSIKATNANFTSYNWKSA